MKMLSKFSCMQIHDKYHNSEYFTYIILQYIQAGRHCISQEIQVGFKQIQCL